MAEWKVINNYPQYEVSNEGDIRNIKSGKILKLKEHSGYKRVQLYHNGISKQFLVHRLVALAFIPTSNETLQINHIDMNRSNNFVDNLEWVTNYHNQILRYGKNLQKVFAINLDLEFSDAEEAGRYFDVPPSLITECCEKHKSCCHTMWQFS